MKKTVTILAVSACLLVSLFATGVSNAKDFSEQSELLRSYSRYEQILTTPAGFSAEQRSLLALTLAAAESQATDAVEFQSVYRQASLVTTYLLMSDTSYTWETVEWVNNHRLTYTYGPGDRLAEQIAQEWNQVEWVNTDKHLYAYDGNGRLSTSTSQEWDTDHWVNVTLMTYTYDGSGNMIEFLGQNWEGGAWVNFMKTTMTFSDGHVATSTTQSWQTGVWVNATKIIYTYDGSDHLTEMLFQVWQGGAWVDQTRTTYTYDGNGQVIESVTQTWQGGAWVNTVKNEYSYDGSGNEILDVYSMWEGSAWLAIEADTSKYSGGYLVEEVRNNIMLAQVNRTQYTHDAHGNVIAELDQVWLASAWVNESRSVYVYEPSLAVRIDNEELPSVFELSQNYPNPFNPTTVIRYSLFTGAQVEITVFNVLGQKVTTLENGVQPAGVYETTWDGTDGFGRAVTSGVYFYRIKAGDYNETRKMMLLK
ncbi:MAG: T9SS type A sorting domain-containing protein [candidate division Zixibacteria bacterium]|nr:T9SS type A sorting domain-containing protein [candidate division Zixibacteria bacterium]